MTIIRRRYTKNFTVIGNEVFSDEGLDLDALGLLCYLRSRPNDWNIATEHLRRRFGCGPEKMQRLMRALLDTGWILRQEVPRGPRGTYGGFEYVVLDEPDRSASAQGDTPETEPPPESEKPLPVPESGSPTPAEPCTAEPESVEPESVDPTPYQGLDSTKGVSPLNPPVDGGTRSDEKRISEREALIGRRAERGTERRQRAERGYRGAAPPPSLTPETAARFERLWATYPVSGRLTAGRGEAAERFAELEPAEQEAAIATAMAYARSCAEMRSQAKSLHRWLRDGRWRNGTLPLAMVPAAAVPIAGAAPAAPASPRDAAGLAAIQAGRTPVGCSTFVRAESPAGAAWEAYFARFGHYPIWRELDAGLGAYLPAGLPPESEAA